MSLYHGKIYKKENNRRRNRYTRKQLERLTTMQLREICYEEKLVKGIASRLDREAFIETILRFLGANQDDLLKKNSKDGFKRLEQFVSHNLGEELVPETPIKNPAQLTIYKGLAIEPRDQYKVYIHEKAIVESNVLLIDEDGQLCGIFYILQNEEKAGEYLLCMEKGMHRNISNQKNYQLLYFTEKDSKYIYDLYMGEKGNLDILVDCYKTTISNVYVQKLQESDLILAIDFGTSNTTAGAYVSDHYLPELPEHEILNGRIKLNTMNLIEFYNQSTDEQKWEAILPTVIGVYDCSDRNNIKYEYGYEAIQQENYASGSNINSVFYEIKRWIHSYEEQVEVIDYQSNLAVVSKGEIIQAYLKYVITQATQQLKCKFEHIHISSPVKLKHQHLKMFQELIPGYKIEQEDALDEGVAVLYNTIASQIERNRFEEGRDYKALIMDCGGGTTDLSSCIFRIEDTKLTYQVDIHTTFENGDTNFGGNNITYRIMQYLKILFTDYYTSKERTLGIEEIMQVLVGDVYRFVDENGVETLYQALDESYENAELFIPTKYKQYRNKSYQDYQRVRGNYHTLWRLAEEIKKSFYGRAGVVSVGLKEGMSAQADIYILQNKSFRLAVIQNGTLDFIYEIPDLTLNIEEINGLIKGDIYHIIKKFLEEFYLDGSLQEFSIIKMTGQSCRIDLFRDAIKEFVAGRSIEFRQKNNYLKDLKLSCLMGAVQYLQDRKTGIIKARIEHCVPVLPYRIFAKDHHQEEKTLIHCNERINLTKGNISRHSDSGEILFYISDLQGNIHAKYSFLNKKEEYEETNYKKINASYYKYVPQEEVDIIVDDEVKFFVYADEFSWGFYVFPVLRQNGKLYMRKETFYPFENEQWELNFFDGTH